jgi:hypothetical protein
VATGAELNADQTAKIASEADIVEKLKALGI